MKLNFARLMFAAVWLLIGLALLLRDSVGLEWMSVRYAPGNLNLGGGLAIAFAGWNVVRWYSTRARSAPPPTRDVSRSTLQRPFEYIPELDFQKPDGEEKPPVAK